MAVDGQHLPGQQSTLLVFRSLSPIVRSASIERQAVRTAVRNAFECLFQKASAVFKRSTSPQTMSAPPMIRDTHFPRGASFSTAM